MNAEIITVGTEILLGDILNSNAQYLARALAAMGFSVHRQTTVGDNTQRLLDALESAYLENDIVVTTGGLGPTEDDLTKETVFQYFGLESVRHEESIARIEGFFTRIGRPMVASNLKQGFFPRESMVLANDNGTAPGCIIEKNGKIAIVLPGPPREMIPMFEQKALPILAKFQDGIIVSRSLRVIGVGESSMEEMVKDLIKGTNPTAAPYAKLGECELRLTAKAPDKKAAWEKIAPVEAEVRRRMGANLYGIDSDNIETVTCRLLIEKKKTIAVAESCTGGLLSGKIINFPGASNVFLQGVVAYSNDAKVARLGVKPETLEKYGAVSEEVAREMAEGIAGSSGSNVGISVTGIAGPDGGTPEKPVGLVYIGLWIDGMVAVKRCQFTGSRSTIRERTCLEALDMLRRALL